MKSKVDVTVFRADQNDVATSTKVHQLLISAANTSKIDASRWSNYDFDFFWCEQGNNADTAKRAAELAVTLKQLDPAATGR